MTVDVLVTSYGRPDALERCLDSLRAQTRAPDTVVVVARDSDADTRTRLAAWSARHPAVPLAPVTVSRPGVLAANNAAYPFLRSAVVAFLDDDSTAPPAWLATLLRHYEDPSVGAVGGRIRNYRDGRLLYAGRRLPGRPNTVDRRGRIVPGQMYPFSGVWETDSLAGGNMSFRRALLPPCDETLRGDGYRYELDLCLQVKAAGHRVLMDGEAVNDHWSAPRPGAVPRGDDARGRCDARFNEAYVLAKHGVGTAWLVLRALAQQMPRDVAGRCVGRPIRPWACARAWFRGLAQGRAAARSRARGGRAGGRPS